MKYLVLILTLVSGINLCHARNADTAYYKHNQAYTYVEVAGGYGYPGSYVGGSANVLVNGYVYSLKFSDNAAANYYHQRSQEFIADEYALMFGKKLSHNNFSNFILSTGVSIDKFIFKGQTFFPELGAVYDYDRIYNTQIGIPVEIKYLNNYGLLGWAGFSVAASVNLNIKRPFFNLTTGFALGHLRERK